MPIDPADKTKCEHAHLYFGSGSYYIFCYSCNQQWISFKTENTDGSGNILPDSNVNATLSGQIRHKDKQ